MDATIVPVTGLRPKLLQCVSRAHRLGTEYVITKNGNPAAVILGYAEWESWKETVEILSNPALLRKLRKTRGYFHRGGKGKTLSEVFSRKKLHPSR